MRVLLVHAYYQQPGGEDLCFTAEVELLRNRGVQVSTFTFDNHEISTWSPAKQARSLFWNADAARRLGEELDRFGPEVVQVFNTFPGLSPAILEEPRRRGIPVVAMLSNYRLFCVNGLLFRQAQVCEDCLKSRLAWKGAVRGCYRGSRTASLAVAASTAWHRGTWLRCVDAFVALDSDGRDRMVQAGLPADRLHVKPNFLDPMPIEGGGAGGFVLFAGRLAPGKGLRTLMQAWTADLPELRIAGDGPLMGELRSEASQRSNIRLMGHTAHAGIMDLMGDAALVVVPSESHETFGRVAMEALASGTPVAASTAGALRNVVRPEVGCAQFQPGHVRQLGDAVRAILGEPDRASVRHRVRADALERFSGDANFRRLMAIYRAVGVRIPAGESARRRVREPRDTWRGEAAR